MEIFNIRNIIQKIKMRTSFLKYEIIEENTKGKIVLSEKIYTKEIILQTTYILLEKYYFYIDFENENFIIYFWSKENNRITKEDINLFLDELIESASYLDQLSRTNEVREVILEKALLGQIREEEK